MPKRTFFTGQPIFNQLLSLIPSKIVNRLCAHYHSDRYTKKFTTYNHLVSMLFCSYHKCTSLREVIIGLQANAHRLVHLGMACTPRRSTLADANKRRSADFFESLYHQLYQHHYGSLPDSMHRKKIVDKLFVVDSTTITLFSEVFKGAGDYKANGKKKGGVKAHMLMRVKEQQPCFIHITASSRCDNELMPMLKLPSGSILVMDKGYNSYQLLAEWTKSKITWVTRLNKSAVWQLVEERTLNKDHYQSGVRSDKIILLGSAKSRRQDPVQKARLITFYDAVADREFQFLCNHMHYSPVTIAELYKKRWQIELLFKRIKQNFQLNDFLGDNQNAIKIQLWSTLIADLLIKVVKDKVEKLGVRKWSFANITGLIRMHLATYIDLYKFLINPEKAIIIYAKEAANYQLKLFKT